MSININQFSQVPIRGELDLQIQKSGILSGQISTNQGSELQAGDFVKLDTSSGNVPQFVAAGTSDVAIGSLIYDVKKSVFEAGDYCQVSFFGGPVMWLTAGDTIAAGADVEDSGSDTVVTLASAKKRGVALDPGTTGTLIRVILNPIKSA